MKIEVDIQCCLNCVGALSGRILVWEFIGMIVKKFKETVKIALNDDGLELANTSQMILLMKLVICT